MDQIQGTVPLGTCEVKVLAQASTLITGIHGVRTVNRGVETETSEGPGRVLRLTGGRLEVVLFATSSGTANPHSK